MRELNLLALDASTESCSVALQYRDEVFERFEIAPKQHTQLILSFVDELLSRAGARLSQLDGIAFAAGPGSFTGLRIAASVTQGLAYAHDLPVVPISTLATVAQGVSHRFNIAPILVALDARMNQIYFGGFKLQKHSLVLSMIDDCVIDPENIELPLIQTRWIGVGSGWERYYDRFPSTFLERIEVVEEDFYPHAQEVIQLAIPKFRNQEVVSADQAIPVYLRDDVVD